VLDLPMDVGMVAAQLTQGQVSPPFRTLEGYLLLRLEDRREERVRLRTILVRVPVGRADSARARGRAADIRRQTLAGEPFDSLAQQYSDDPTTADSGGILGGFLLDGLSEPFKTVVAGMDSGQISEPVLSEHGYHLVKVLELERPREMGYLEMQDGIRNYLYQQRLNQRLEEYVGRISKKVFIKRFG
jgi:parvulin-like peptidyl-prolyl isomerase